VPKAIGSSQHHVLRVSDIGLGGLALQGRLTVQSS